MESYESERQPISLYQFIKYAMVGLFIIIFGVHILLPSGIGKPSIFTMRKVFSQQLEAVEDMYEKVKVPDVLYDNVNCIKSNDIIIENVSVYRTEDAKSITGKYRSYLELQNLQFYQELENGFVMYDILNMNAGGKSMLQYYYKVTVTYAGNDVTVEEEMVENLEEKVDSFDPFG